MASQQDVGSVSVFTSQGGCKLITQNQTKAKVHSMNRDKSLYRKDVMSTIFKCTGSERTNITSIGKIIAS